MKRVAVLYSEYYPVIDAIKYHLSEYCVDCISDIKDTDEYDLIICLGNKKSKGNAISCHHSLLPAFNCEEPEKEAVLEGVKVTGITIYYQNTGKIIAQYPVFIKNDTHYDDLNRELTYLEQILLPLVAKQIIKNEPFDVSMLTKTSCNGKCGGCLSCSH